MPINGNIARVMQKIKQERHLSIQEFSDELGITKSAAQIYLKGKGNPRADTLELLAKGCGLSITQLVSDPLPGEEQVETMVGAAHLLSGLPPDRREACVQHLLAIAAIFAEMQDD